MKRPPYKTLISLLVLSFLVISRIHSHSLDFNKIRAGSLESPNGYINVFLNLAGEMEWTLAQNENTGKKAAEEDILTSKNFKAKELKTKTWKKLTTPTAR